MSTGARDVSDLDPLSFSTTPEQDQEWSEYLNGKDGGIPKDARYVLIPGEKVPAWQDAAKYIETALWEEYYRLLDGDPPS